MIHRLFLQPSARHRTLPLILLTAGAIAVGYGIHAAPERAWPTLLLNGFYILSLSVSAIFFLASQRLTGARWSASLRRIPEALMAPLPAAAIVMMLLYFGRHSIFVWSIPGAFAHETEIAGKVQYLQEPYVFERMALWLSLWIAFGWLFRKVSLRQDQHPKLNLTYHQLLNRLSIAFVLVFALSFTLGSYDWLVSLDPQWFTTMFGVYVFAGTFVQGIAAITLTATFLRRTGVSEEWITDHQLHDLGKMLFAFSTFWAYIWTCQYLLIWYGNIPDEVTYYVKRTNGPWVYLFALNLVLNWILPFMVLLSAKAKCKTSVLRFVCVVLLLGHWLDLYVLVMPTFSPVPAFGPFELLIALGCGSLFYILFIRSLASAPLMPIADPILAAEVQHAHSFGKEITAGINYEHP
jgi:hypothetical protein